MMKALFYCKNNLVVLSEAAAKIEQSDFKIGSGKLLKESFNESYIKEISKK